MLSQATSTVDSLNTQSANPITGNQQVIRGTSRRDAAGMSLCGLRAARSAMTSCVIKPHQYGTSEGCRSSLRCSHSAYLARSPAEAETLAARVAKALRGATERTREELSIMATETGSVGATVTRPADVGLKREMGL